ncbi:TetR/AcrR family transcriptional regulator [Pseudooceanicola sp. CBS1P-1]|uniref:TetR family transcriptional regulator n=1 Tax=Pseudooceanicola albus TaxID=2692189 RepID=A0A6L7G5H5_9RHOB|nr:MULTISPECIES: TetR/AcrR family transcriptional regulator [Pseudooceanicola]MBT9385403.1 TetR/AcrR family transcriptional regulator [Pseudooceanicola endophyticus]MXN18738.1 TetR family transcriptional regulator [Pseudooceanicola albus]
MARPRASDFDEKRHGLLLTAAHVFATQGMEKASMSQIAAQAGVSKSLLYHYYPSKDALIFAIIESHLQELDEALEAARDPALDHRSQLETYVMTVLDAYRGADDQHKVQLNAGPALSEDQKAQIVTLERAIVRHFSDVIRAIHPDLDRPDRPLLMPVTMSLFGMMNWVYMWFREGGKISRADYAQMATTLILEGVKAVR